VGEAGGRVKHGSPPCLFTGSTRIYYAGLLASLLANKNNINTTFLNSSLLLRRSLFPTQNKQKTGLPQILA
jgi:hypothetical protein